MGGLTKRLKRKLVEWLLRDIDVIKVGGNTCILTSDFLELASLSADPTLAAGRVWYRVDLRQLRYTDGTRRFGLVPNKVLRSGRYFGSFDSATAFTTRALTANVLYAYPMFVPEDSAFDRIAINVTTAAAGSARVGVYTDGGAYPGTLVSGSDVGALDTGTTGVKENAISITLTPGVYWLAVVASAAATLRAVPVASLDSEILGLDSTLGTAPGTGYYVSYTFAPLPSTFPSGASVDTGAAFLVALRRA